MPNKNGIRGKNFERVLVDKFKDSNIIATRAWGSNGRALGHAEEVDILLGNGLKIQAKKRKVVPKYINEWLTNVDLCILGEDRKDPIVIMPFQLLLELLNYPTKNALNTTSTSTSPLSS